MEGEITKKLDKDRYWVFFCDKETNDSKVGHWGEDREEIIQILENGFYDGYGNKCDNFKITDYDLNVIYEQGDFIGIEDSVLPDTKIVGESRYVNTRTKGAADYEEEAVLEAILKDNEYLNYGEVFCTDEKGEDHYASIEELAERLKKLKEKIISENLPQYEKQERDEESPSNIEMTYDNLLKEVSDLVREIDQCNLQKAKNEKHDVSEIQETISDRRPEDINKVKEEILETMTEVTLDKDEQTIDEG